VYCTVLLRVGDLVGVVGRGEVDLCVCYMGVWVARVWSGLK
jgi:hypothetical protein